MFRTDKENTFKILCCCKPSLIFIGRPWGVDLNDWIGEFKSIGYSVIDIDREDRAFPERIRERINRRLLDGRVLVYGIAPEQELLEKIMPEEYVMCWIYPNKQTDYFKMIEIKCGDIYKVKTDQLPIDALDLWKEYMIIKSFDLRGSILRRLTKICHAYQKKMYDRYVSNNDRIMVILI